MRQRGAEGCGRDLGGASCRPRESLRDAISGDRSKCVENNPKCRCLGHDVSNLLLESIAESCEFGEDRVLVGLRPEVLKTAGRKL